MEKASYSGPPLGHTVDTVAIVFGAITICAICLRMYGRAFLVRAIGLDDALMVIASLLSWGFIVATILAVHYGLGEHIDKVMEMGTITSYSKVVWLSSIFYNATLGFIKMSVLALYTRLGDKNLRFMSYIMMMVVGCSAGANVLVCIFQCNPIPAAWDTSITVKKCVNINAFYLANASTNIATDLVTYCMPLKTVRSLHIPLRQKIAVGIMLCLGLLACISSIIRITYIPRMLSSPDSTYVISNAMYWSAIETNVGILSASFPSLKIVLATYVPRLLGDSLGSRNKNTNPSGHYHHNSNRKSGFSKLAGIRRERDASNFQGPDSKDHTLTTDIIAINDSSNDIELSIKGRNDSEEHIIDRAGQGLRSDAWNGGIVRTTEFARTVETNSDY